MQPKSFIPKLLLATLIASCGCSVHRWPGEPLVSREAISKVDRSRMLQAKRDIEPVSFNQEVDQGEKLERSVDIPRIQRPALEFQKSETPDPLNTPVSTYDIQADSITLEAAEQLALSTNPDLQQALAEIQRLEGKRLQVGLKPNPQFGYLAADVGEEQTAGQQGVFFSQEFIRGGKLELNRSIVCQEIKAAQQQLEINRQKLLSEVRQRFYDLLIAQERVALANRFDQLAQDAVAISEKLFEAQEISKVGFMRAQIQAQNTTIVLQQAQNELSGARNRFAAVTGWGQPTSVASSLLRVTGSVYPNASISNLEDTLAKIQEDSPEIAQAMAGLERAKWNLNRQLVEPTRNIQVQTGLTHGNVTGEDLVALQVGMPIRINDRNQGNIAAARAEVLAQTQQIDSLKRDLAIRFSVVYRDYENARIQIERYQQEIIPQASEFYQLVATAFKVGELDYLDLVSAQQTYLDVSLKNLDALRDFWRSVALIDSNLLSEDG